MWSKVGVLLFVGLVAATNYAWLPNTEYTYTVRSRSLTSLGLDDNYSGVFYKAKLSIKTGGFNEVQQRLSAKLLDVQVVQMHNMTLPEGWESDVELPESKALQITQQPFHILIKDNVITGMEVSSKMPKWEANMIRGIISQLQIQIDPKAGCTYNIMEETVTGEHNTIYEFCGADRKDESAIYVTKTKNFEESSYSPSIHYGFGQTGDMEIPNSNQMGKFFAKSSVSNVRLMGQLHRFNISSSETVNEITVSPTLTSTGRALVGSKVNVTLDKRTTSNGQYPRPDSSVIVSIVYEQDSPYEKDATVSKNQRLHETERTASPLSEEYGNDSENQERKEHQNQAKIQYLMGGIGIESTEYLNNKLNLPELAQKLSKQIAQELKDAENIPTEQTLSKYLILVRITSVMGKSQIKEVEQKLYSRQEEGEQRTAWQVYRDAVSESGNRQAFKIIKEWIAEKKVEGWEAAQVIATIIDSVTLPDEQFAREVFEFVQHPEILSKKYVNDSAILAAATMMRKVFVDDKTSYLNFPVHNFKAFRTEEGYKFVVDNFEPYLIQQLKNAVQHKDNHKMSVYIRALGNTAGPATIQTFNEQFWSNAKAPLFQRVQSLLALNKVRAIQPELTREVLFRIYNNDELPQEMRVVAVHQIMRTNPPKTMLQQMARNTNIHKNEYVNSAVQSNIREAAQLNNEDDRELAENAKSAVHFLTQEVYGQQYSKAYIKEYFVRNVQYMQKLNQVGSMDSFIPQTIKARLTAMLGGLKQEIYEIEALTSSIDDLLNYFQLRNVKSSGKQTPQDIDNIYVEDDESEQLQGVLRYKLGGLETLLSFDDDTIAAYIRQFEKDLQKQKSFQMTKLLNRENLFLVAPLESGSVYSYSLDTPTYLHWGGKVSFEAQPSISNGEQIQKVQEFNLKSENHIVLSRKMESRLSIVTVFDHQEYSSGFDKNWQVNFPVTVSVRGDIKGQEYKVQIEPTKERNFEFFHFSTWPILGRRDIWDMRPISNKPDTHVVKVSPLYSQQFSLFKQSGIAVRVNSTSEQPITLQKIFERFQKGGVIGTLMSVFHSHEMDHTQYTLTYDAKQSVARKINVEFGKRQMTNDDVKDVVEKTGEDFNLEKMTDNKFYYATIKMEGQETVQYKFKAGFAQDLVKLNKEAFYAFNKVSQAQGIKPYQMIGYAKVKFPTTSQLSFSELMKMDLKAEGKYFFCMGEHCESQMQGPIIFKRSEDRKQYLNHQEGTQACWSQEYKMEQSQEYARCDNYTDDAGLFDKVDVTIKHKNSEYLLQTIAGVYEAASQIVQLPYFPYWKQKQDQVQIRFAQDFTNVNVTSLNANGHYSVNFIPVNQWAKRAVAVHPSYDIQARFVGKYLETKTFEPTCSINPVSVNTFDDVVYTPEFENKQWQVLFHYNESFNQAPEEDQRITYTVLARKNGEAKEVRVRIVHPRTKSEVATIDLIPVGHFKPAIKVNDQQQEWSTKKAGQFYNQFITFYGNTDNEIRVEIADDFYVVYNGQSIRIAATDDKLRGSLRGLCGDFDGNKYAAGSLPNGCQPKSDKDFVKAYRYPMEKSQLQGSEHCSQRHTKITDILGGLKQRNNNYSSRRSSPKFSRYGQ